MRKIIVVIILAIIALGQIYYNLPVINFGYWELAFNFLILSFIALFLSTFIIHYGNKKGLKSNSNIFILLFIGVILFYMILIPIITSWSLFRSSDYRNLIGKVESSTKLSNYLPPISIDKIRIIDKQLANILGDKVLGQQPALGSQVDLGAFTIQKVNNQLYWVAPLLHSGFFKWNNNREGTNGYVIVNASNERDVKLVQHINNKPIKIKYQLSAYFQDNLQRHIYFNGYMTDGFSDYTFEIDDNGIPFWVVTKFKKRIGFSGQDAVGVIVVNAESGDIKEYSIANAPLWIDRIQPANFIENQLNDWGEYVKGYWNFSNEDKLKITEDVTLVYGEDNKSYWYTGLTSVGADEATVGFVLVDTRTKKTVWYKQSGATESAAQNSALGKVQEKGYYASNPIPYNINNIPTYVMTLKDRGGLIKMYAMVSIEDYTIVGVGNSLQETLMAYKNAFNMTDSKIDAKSISSKTTIKSIITRINSDIKNGNSYYYLKIKDSKNIFVGSTQISNELPISSVGDSVEMTFDNDDEKLTGISSFKNKSIYK